LQSRSISFPPIRSAFSKLRNYPSNRTALITRAALFVLLSVVSVAGQARWCAEDHIAGLQGQAIRARALLGSSSTSDPARMTVYLTTAVLKNELGIDKRLIYVHSNYRMPGMPHESKFVTTSSELDVTIPNLLYQVGRDFYFDTSHVKFVVEQTFFSDPEFGQLDFGKDARVKIVGPDNEIRPSILISTGERVISWGPYIYTWANEPGAIEALNRLSSQPLVSTRIRFLNLVIHSKTLENINFSIPGNNRLSFDLDALSGQDRNTSLKALEKQLAGNPGSILFVLGHIDIDTGEFLVEDAAGKVILRLGVRELEEMAGRYATTVFSLGCSSVHNARRGTTGTIGSIEAVERMSAAMRQSSTFGDFFLNLSSPEIKIVIDQAILDGAQVRLNASLYKKRDSFRRGASNTGGGGDTGGGGGTGGGGDTGGGDSSGARPSPRRPNADPDGVLYVHFIPPDPTLQPVVIGPVSGSPSPSPSDGGEAGAVSNEGGFKWPISMAILAAAIGVVIVARKVRNNSERDRVHGGVTSLNLNRSQTAGNGTEADNSKPKSDPTSNASSKIIVTCVYCGAGNMVIETRLSAARCGKCKRMLGSTV
jgi:hypothetical protein